MSDLPRRTSSQLFPSQDWEPLRRAPEPGAPLRITRRDEEAEDIAGAANPFHAHARSRGAAERSRFTVTSVPAPSSRSEKTCPGRCLAH